jgi:hypothetical protein
VVQVAGGLQQPDAMAAAVASGRMFLTMAGAFTCTATWGLPSGRCWRAAWAAAALAARAVLALLPIMLTARALLATVDRGR